ncbi:MAG TPA: endopeptidase La [Gemmataceae bacterium]|jgi:ATP-dependent Lon protease|nr:endopeptidase La [Gemmataceae bacterium]
MNEYPVLPIKNTVLFPGLFLPLSVGRPASRAALEAGLATEDKQIVVVAQRDADRDAPGLDDVYPVGTLAVIKKLNRSADSFEILVQGTTRVRLLSLAQSEPFLKANVEQLPVPESKSDQVEAQYRAVLDGARKVLELARPQGDIDIDQMLAQAPGPVPLSYLLASMMGLDVVKEQALLEAESPEVALGLILDHLNHEVQVLGLRNQIASKAQAEMSKEQKDYWLRQQMRAIQTELGEDTPEKSEVAELRRRFDEVDLPEHVRKEADRELKRLERLPSQAPDFQVTRTYLELILELPWKKEAPSVIDLPAAKTVLDEDHYGLEKIKDRILEHLAVLKLNPKAKAPILCLVGPPGVGKTSLGQSVAKATGRPFERVSLGGMHDESELRGHRRTYIGAMPGRLIQALRRAGANNPVLMLDEIDKLGRDYRGDPAAALLEILDPSQNHTFRDNYLDLPFDLSNVLFITTANTLDTLPAPLLDRLEVLRLSGYAEAEKVEIARRYLTPRQVKETGLPEGSFHLPDETVRLLVTRYTREAGVRQLEQVIGRLARKVAVRFAKGETDPVTVGPEDLTDLLGPERVSPEDARKTLPPGVATGLAYTEAGGDVLYIEASLLPKSRGLKLTGQLGDVMKESAAIARSLIWSQSERFGLDPKKFRDAGVHVHVPAGAVPKDGPSAGVAMVTALASLYSGTPARADTAMTGEVTLTGLVLPIGGVKEKVLAARRAGITRVVLPKANGKDLRDVPEPVRSEMTFFLAETVEDVLAATLPQGDKVGVRRPAGMNAVGEGVAARAAEG